MEPRSHRRRPAGRAVPCAVVALAAACAGCGKAKQGNPFEEIARLPSREEFVEVDLGRFLVPVPLVDNASEDFELANLLQLDFQLVAIVSPDDAKKVKRLLERHEGRLRDEVIRVCRSTPRDDLMESEWGTLKAHLLDATQPLLGGALVRRLATPQKVIESL